MKNKYITPILIVILCLSFTACKKDSKELVFNGKVLVSGTSEPVSNARVTLASTAVQSWVYHANFQDVASVETDSDGSFSITVDEMAASAYRIYIYKKDYFEYSSVINAQDVSSEDIYYNVYNIFSKASVDIHVANYTPDSEDDRITYRIVKGGGDCFDCCPTDYIYGIGMSYDTTISCMTYGHHYLVIESMIQKNENIYNRKDSVYINPLEENSLTILY